MYVYRRDAVRWYGAAVSGGMGDYMKHVQGPVLISPYRPVLEPQLVKQGRSIILLLSITVAAYYLLTRVTRPLSSD
jgi:hypothetical protein